MSRTHFDAVIVGGGISGVTSGAALAREGLSVLVCEAGLPSDRRLAGELMHPPAAVELERLGLLEPLVKAGAAPVYGFAIFRDAADPGTVLSYSEIRGGRPSSVALEHATMTRALLGALEDRPNVTVWNGVRVVAVDSEGPRPSVTVRRHDALEVVHAPLVVLADGRDSRFRARTGIAAERGGERRMIGLRVPGGRLPYPGYGHVFTGGGAVVLAYQIDRGAVRVMFELAPGTNDPSLEGLPPALRQDVVRAMESEPMLSAKVYPLEALPAAHGRVAVVGDAAGCVHPLTASGIAFCTQDAVRLAREVGTSFAGGAGVPAALERYAARRMGPMRTRAALGPALVDALEGDGADLRLLRAGLFRTWERSPAGRSASLALLSTHEPRPLVMAREYARVCLHALRAVGDGAVKKRELPAALFGLARRSAAEAVRAFG